MGSQWNGMGAQLMHVPIFRDVIDRCDKVLSPRGLDIKHIITSTDKDIFENILHAFVGITATQIGLVEVLRALELEPEGIVGHSVGELGCAYADNCLTLEQTILAAYARGRASLESTLIKGMMAAIGLGYGDILSRLPKTIDVACRNSDTSCTISGPAADVEEFVTELKAKGIFARSVNVANIAYHSRYIQPAAPILLKYLKEVIPEKTKRSEKWISSSVPKKDWSSDLATYSSPDYHTNNLLSPVLFEDAIKSIPSNAVCIEIAPHGLLQAILKRALPTKVTNVPLTHRSSPDGVKFLLDAIGQ
nr:PREDICTED: fatty acid synthase-like [Bemisia tabaci]